MIAVIATVRARAGKEQELGDALRTLITPTRKEAGCIEYDLHVAGDDPAAYAFYERWDDQAALDAHLKTPHFTAAAARIAELAEGPPVIGVYRLVE